MSCLLKQNSRLILKFHAEKCCNRGRTLCSHERVKNSGGTDELNSALLLHRALRTCTIPLQRAPYDYRAIPLSREAWSALISKKKRGKQTVINTCRETSSPSRAAQGSVIQ